MPRPGDIVTDAEHAVIHETSEADFLNGGEADTKDGTKLRKKLQQFFT